MASLIIMRAKAVTGIRNELQLIAVKNWRSEWWGMLRLWESLASCCVGLENFNHIYIGYSWDQSLFNSVSKVQLHLERVKFQHEVWTMWYVPNEHWQKCISIRKCRVMKETAVDRTKKKIFFRGMSFSWSFDNSVYILSLTCVDDFFQAYDVDLSSVEKVEGQKYVSWQKYQLSDVRTLHREGTGGKYRPIIHLTFHDIFGFHFGHQNSELYWHSKWNCLKSIMHVVKSRHCFGNHGTCLINAENNK